MLAVALEQARIGLAEGGVPVGGAIFHTDGTLLGAGQTDWCKKVTGRCMAKPTPFEPQDDGRPGTTPSWSRRWPRAGTAAA